MLNGDSLKRKVGITRHLKWTTYFNLDTKFSNASWQINKVRSHSVPRLTLHSQWLKHTRVHSSHGDLKSVASSPDSVAVSCQGSISASLLVFSLNCLHCKTAAAVPDITSRFKAWGREEGLINHVCSLYQEKQKPL